ncbi:hypothetical protein DFH06DRAFT_1166104 [Mycena polygramma]|nr:hypothetical protein DFH06DRAFT_1166104 [Mycena polygramma]
MDSRRPPLARRVGDHLALRWWWGGHWLSLQSNIRSPVALYDSATNSKRFELSAEMSMENEKRRRVPFLLHRPHPLQRGPSAIGHISPLCIPRQPHPSRRSHASIFHPAARTPPAGAVLVAAHWRKVSDKGLTLKRGHNFHAEPRYRRPAAASRSRCSKSWFARRGDGHAEGGAGVSAAAPMNVLGRTEAEALTVKPQGITDPKARAPTEEMMGMSAEEFREL